MGVFGISAANDIASIALTFYLRGKTLAQTIQTKPLLAWLRSGSKTFPGGKDYISSPVQGAYMSDTAGFMVGYADDTLVTFAGAANVLRCQYVWRETHSGLAINWTDLKKDGITVTENQKTSEHSEVALTRLVGLLENRLDDFGESWARANNLMLWQDGSQDALQVPGILAILDDTPLVGTVGGLDQAVRTWWRPRVTLNLVPSPTDSTLIKFFNSEMIQLQRYGGRPDKALCGSAFLDALRSEVIAKGLLTQSGFNQASATNIGVNKLSIPGLGTFEYDPTLDSISAAMSKRCYVMDGRRVKLRPMEGEDNKMLTPERPHNYMGFLKSITWTGGLECTQLNANGVYSIA